VGGQGVPVNRTAAAAGIAAAATDPEWTLTVAGPHPVVLTLAELAVLPQHEAVLPIACVEGWSATATWTWVRLGVSAAWLVGVLVVTTGCWRRCGGGGLLATPRDDGRGLAVALGVVAVMTAGALVAARFSRTPPGVFRTRSPSQGLIGHPSELMARGNRSEGLDAAHRVLVTRVVETMIVSRTPPGQGRW
jgi:hypothetical protein